MEIVVRQVSGLGNQLFQYAAGRFFAQRYQASLRIVTDLSHNAHSYGHPRPFLLPHFYIDTPMRPFTRLERLLFTTRPALKPLARALQQALKTEFILESKAQQHTFVPDLPFQETTRTLYLTGYWQAHRFADSVSGQLQPGLRKELRLRTPATGRNLALVNQITATPHSVSLHIRRGDYALPQEGNIVLPATYYANAIAYMRSHLVNPTFFVFSDDMPHARAILPSTLKAVFVDHNDDVSSHEDLRLMSACRHHIIANSSFSWWGAWLNPNPDKLVFAPKFWRLTPDTFYPDLLPPEWAVGTF